MGLVREPKLRLGEKRMRWWDYRHDCWTEVEKGEEPVRLLNILGYITTAMPPVTPYFYVLSQEKFLSASKSCSQEHRTVICLASLGSKCCVLLGL